ncbi:hypothetical protein COCVIDRAFT_47473, partial [Bipolaris victoriae FI3]
MPHTQYVVLWLCIRARRPFYSLYTEAHVKGLLNANLDALVLVLLERSSCSSTYWKLVVIFRVLIHVERRMLKSIGHRTSAEVRPDGGS